MKKTKRKICRFLPFKNNDYDVPSVAFTCGFCTEIASNTEAVVYGIRCILDYTPECIKLRHKCGNVSFMGKSLSCNSYVEGAICIKGIIDSVHYENG